MCRSFTTAHICSWVGLCSGNNESAGKRRNGKTTKGNKTLKSILVQCAKSAVRSESFFAAQYEKIVVRRGRNRATVAAAHSKLIAIYHMRKSGLPFKDLGTDYYTQFNKEKKIKSYLKKSQSLGWGLPATAVV
jgi:transposase